LRSEWRGALWVGSSAKPDNLNRIASVPDSVWRARVGWTPDGRILFTSTVSGNRDVWIVRPDGSDLRQLTTSPGYDSQAATTPDNRYIVFCSDRDGRARVWRMEPDGGGQTPLTEGPFDQHPVVSADGSAVYYSRYGQGSSSLYAVPVEGGEPTLLSGPLSMSPPGKWTGVPAGFWPFVLSPDGTLLAGTYWDMGEHRIRVGVVPVDGHGSVHALDFMLPWDADYSFTWAPDGRAITFVKTADGAVNLWRQPLDDSPATRLTNYTSSEDVVSHAWSPDGKLLVLVRGTAEGHVVVMRDVRASR
jgi:Tol biopolymer transport system component